MINEIVFDIETQNTFQEVGGHNLSLLKVSLVGVYFYATNEYKVYFENDLKDLWPLFEHADRVIGYNIRGFDLPVLNNYYAGDLMKFPHLDLMDEIVKSTGFRIKLDDVASATNGEGKSGSGLAAVEYWRTGNLEKLKSYCLDDVRITRDVYEFGKKNGFLKYKDWLGKVAEVKVDFGAGQTSSAKQPINLTMAI
jgi:DEAD/DEAH box helicase domain-containing protein